MTDIPNPGRIVPPQGGTGITRPAVTLPQTWSSNYPGPQPDPACEGCRHFARLKADGGECRFNPPTSRAAEKWPWVENAEFCGRFEPKGQPARPGLTRVTEG